MNKNHDHEDNHRLQTMQAGCIRVVLKETKKKTIERPLTTPEPLFLSYLCSSRAGM